MAEDIRSKIDALVKNNEVLLFMKGNREHPQCGFSRQVVEILSELVLDFHTEDVLADGALREAVKAYSSWPTLPQLYIKGEFVGGCDIVNELYASEELQKKLGLSKSDAAPHITISEKANRAFVNACAEEGSQGIRIKVGANFRHTLEFDSAKAGDFSLNQEGFKLIIDAYSAKRAEGLAIDFIEEGLEPGFSFINPSEPKAVSELSVQELALWREQNKEFLLFDVRLKDE